MLVRPSAISLSALCLALFLAGCAVDADYEKPEVTVPPTWASAPSDPVKAGVDQQWWKAFKDPVLTTLIDKAASDNLDLKIAEARINQARSGVASAEAALLPQGDVRATAAREANQMASPSESFSAMLRKPYNIYQIGFDASWELDLFGGHRRAEQEATARMQASEATRDDLRVSLLAEVARTYVAIRACQAQLALTQDVLAVNARIKDIARQRAEVGQTSRVESVQAKARWEQARTQLPFLRNQLAQAEYALDVLLGEQPGFAHKVVAAPAPVPSTDPQLLLAAPASVLAQRPDIRAAERQLAAATAQQGVALAKFFPDVSLSGFFGALGTAPNKLLTPTSESWMAGGGILWPILSYNALSANLDAANAQQQEALARYQKTILAALSNVERAWVSHTQQEEFLQASANEAQDRKRAQSLARNRYEEGLTSRMEALESDLGVAAAQMRLIQAQADSAQTLIALYKSLGGGWGVAAKI